MQAQNSTKQLPATSSSNDNSSFETIEGEVIEDNELIHNNSKVTNSMSGDGSLGPHSLDEETSSGSDRNLKTTSSVHSSEFSVLSSFDEDFWAEVEAKDNQKLAEIEANYYQSSDAPTSNSINTQSKTDSNSSRVAYSNTTIGQDLVLTDEFSGRTVRYKDYTGVGEQQEKEVSPEQRKKVFSMISDLAKGFKLKKAEAEAAEASLEPSLDLLGDLDLLNQDLICPVLRKDSITKHRVQKWLNAGYSCDYDLDGDPCFVYKS